MGQYVFKIKLHDQENEFHENFSKIINFLVWKLTKLKYADIDYIGAMNRRSSSSFKMKKDLFTLKKMYIKIQKGMNTNAVIVKTYLTKLKSPLWDFKTLTWRLV